MKINNKKIKGVLHKHRHEQKYTLRRYFPNEQFQGFIEQFWLVDWHLKENKPHYQQNLPDPNFHLVINGKDIKVLGPVSKVYTFKMQGRGRIIGVKFEVGALKEILPHKMSECVDRSFLSKDVFGSKFTDGLADLYHTQCDTFIINKLQDYLISYIQPKNKQKAITQSLVNRVKNDADIYTVEQMACLANLSPRAVQRYFSAYVGLNPKWVIRKYRLSRVLEAFEEDKNSVLDVVTKLGYVDQSHLIKDFREILGITPTNYHNPETL